MISGDRWVVFHPEIGILSPGGQVDGSIPNIIVGMCVLILSFVERFS